MNGLISLPWWGYILLALVLTHITIASVTIYLHRNQAHRAIDLHPFISHFFRFWLWLTTGMNTKEWVAIHRKHHAKVEKKDDPHSPQIHGIKTVLWQGVELYRRESLNQATLEQYGHATPEDWIERNLYSRFTWTGIVTLLLTNFILFGFIGISIWAIQMMWIPLFAAGVINGIGHYWGYRNFDSSDTSTNIVPIGIIIGGEEMHNNHHAFASSAKFSSKWWEFDIGWLYIKAMSIVRLAKVNKLPPTLILNRHKSSIDIDTVKAVINNRLQIMSDYASDVITRVYKEERLKAKPGFQPILKCMKNLLTMSQFSMDSVTENRLQELLKDNDALKVVYESKQRLQAIWQEKSASHEVLMQALQDWCKHAEDSGIKALQEFALNLRAYSLQPV